MAQEKIRVYVLARELGLDTKDLLDACQKANIDVRNQLSSLDPEQRDVIVEILRRGKTASAAPAAPARPAATLTPPPAKIQTLPTARPPVLPARPSVATPTPPAAAPAPAPAPTESPAPAAEVSPAPVAPAVTVTPPPAPVPEAPAQVPAAKVPVAPATPAAQPPVAPPALPSVSTPKELPGKPVVPAVSAPVAPVPAPDLQPAAKVVPEPTAPAAPVAPAAPTVTPAATPAAEARPRVEPPAATPAPARTEPPAPPTPVQPVRPAASAPPARPAATTPVQSPRPHQPIGPQRTPPSIAPRPQPPLGGPRVIPPGPRPTPPGGGQGGAGDRKRPAPSIGIQRRPTPSSVRGDMGKKPGGHTPATTPTPVQPKQESGGVKRLGTLTAEQLARTDKPIKLEDLLRPPTPVRGPGVPPVVVPPVGDEAEGEEDDRKGKKPLRPGEVPGRAVRHKERSDRAKERQVTRLGGSAKEVAAIAIDEVVRPSKHGGRRHDKHNKRGGPAPKIVRTGKVPIELPITVRTLSAAVGMRSGELLMKLMGFGAPPTININSTLDPVLAETLALDLGTELDIKRPVDIEQEVVGGAEKPDAPEDLVPRAPIVTIMGHVDHGKTSLLDRIRQKYGVQSNVVATEAGGITQSLRAWRVEKDGKPVTFLDTPGHEAFTKMRARGANVTDIAVIVVAVDDGVMPQTEEAISHAKAAGVAMVVALNKVDLPNANLRKAEQQLYSLGLLPDNMGGDIPFIQTSATTGKGIDELLENLSLVAEMKELKANPERSASGTCLEATVSEGEGVNATILVRNGTLRRGDVVLCGSAYGRVRQLYNDHGQSIEEAGPSVPARITGLDMAPNADDPFVVVEDLATAREIAEKRAEKQHLAQVQGRGPATLEALSAAKVTELKIILKADVRGSVEAIRKELEKLHHEEVRLRVLHTGIGGITENDVTLALTSPSDTIIVGFNVVPDDRALQLAEERGVQIREYDIIYKLTDDLKAALEGKLKPREEVVHLGRAVIREIFKISRVGTIAGCYVTQGTIERAAKVRVIRNGVVVYPPVDRTAGLESLKRFKDDAREVQQGYECGIKIAGYDDVKVDDVIEAYRIEQVQRTLS